ncbi:MAG: epoxyqueuosine reductase QueH [Lachnospiraceae bacterium]|nr:epoxyqueuosine reductase QueH [Lachnospiraceae bacterium]MDE6982418.1 epoxyqueuosine reductase QueH [Lachnospiraceae bacterium]
MNRRNYQRELEEKIQKISKDKAVPKLLLHSCCAPCSSYVIEYLSQYFSITVFYYNPNIYPDEEYEKRVEEQKRFIREFPAKYPVDFIRGDFEKESFYEAVRGLEDTKEGGERCSRCFYLRLSKTAFLAQKLKADYFTTTLSISPLKNADRLNEIGEELSRKTGVSYLCSDFKKKNGYKRSVELSADFGMYRQDYCGCIFSKQEREAQKEGR